MKRFDTPSATLPGPRRPSPLRGRLRPAEERAASALRRTELARRWQLLAVVVLATAAGAGCVAKGTYDRATQERDALAARAAEQSQRILHLEASNQSLSTELDRSLEHYEDLLIERDELAASAADLRTKEVELAARLDTKSAALEKSQTQLEAATAEVARLTDTYTTLMSDLEAEVASGQIQIEQLREGIRVNVSDEILFASGSTNLDDVGRKVLENVIEKLKPLNHMIEVQGHTDDRPIRGPLKLRFPSNWELAAARAALVVRLMQERGIEGERLSAVSFAAFRPVASNDTPANRSLNRRIEIRLLPRPGAAP